MHLLYLLTVADCAVDCGLRILQIRVHHLLPAPLDPDHDLTTRVSRAPEVVTCWFLYTRYVSVKFGRKLCNFVNYSTVNFWEAKFLKVIPRIRIWV